MFVRVLDPTVPDLNWVSRVSREGVLLFTDL